jgi:hypothetical protein
LQNFCTNLSFKGIIIAQGFALNIIKKTALYFARKEFCREAICENADLGIFKERLTKSVVAGIILIVFSNLIGLPTAVIVGGFVIVTFNASVAAVVAVLIYGISWLLFMLGVYLAGPKYGRAFSRWAVRVILVTILGDEAKTSVVAPVENPEKTNK